MIQKEDSASDDLDEEEDLPEPDVIKERRTLAIVYGHADRIPSRKCAGCPFGVRQNVDMLRELGVLGPGSNYEKTEETVNPSLEHCAICTVSDEYYCPACDLWIMREHFPIDCKSTDEDEIRTWSVIEQVDMRCGICHRLLSRAAKT